MVKRKTVLIAPLHWGLGHATRCIPIIKAVLKKGFNVLIASDGAALLLLRKEFPQLPFITLPSYDITYPKNGNFFKLKLLLMLPKIKKVIASERKIIDKLVSEGKIDAIISDNRFGVYNKEVPSVFITHQLNVLSGNTSYFTSKIHQKVIQKFDACWIPDREANDNLSGKLGHVKGLEIQINYIGIVSRFAKQNLPKKYDVLVLLSGPEPQRSLFEKIILKTFKNTLQQVLVVSGVVEERKVTTKIGNLTLVNFMTSSALETALNESELIISRSGYTTLMDLAVLKQKAFFVPTPGQYEQEYLATRMEEMKIAPFCKQVDFKIEQLKNIENYKGFTFDNKENNLSKLLSFFERE